MKYSISILILVLTSSLWVHSQTLYPNVDFDLGPSSGSCQCPTTWTCSGDAGRVSIMIHTPYSPGDQGCMTGQNYLADWDPVFSPPAAVYFYGDGDNIQSQGVDFTTADTVCMNVKYKGPVNGTADQNTTNCHFSFAIDGVQVGPDILVPTDIPWTFIEYAFPVSAGTHSFGLLSGGPGDYAIWFDELITYTTGCQILPCDSSWNAPTICAADGPILLDSLITGVSGGSWSGIGVNGNMFDPSFGTQDITYTTPPPCFSSLTQTINVHGPVVTLSSTNISCFGAQDGTATLNITGGSPASQILWNTGDTISTLSSLGPGTYTVQYLDTISGCNAQLSTIIAEPDSLWLSLVSINGCLPNPAQVNAQISGGILPYDLNWSGLSDTVYNINSLTGGWFHLTVTDSNGCVVNDSSFAEVFPAPSLSIMNDTLINLGDCLEIFTSGDSIIHWEPVNNLDCSSCQNPIACPDDDITYCAYSVDSNLCMDTACVFIDVEIICGDVFVPSAFSPNGDNVNDRLCVYSDCLQEFTFQIYNRWGQVVFSSTSFNECWDGSWKGKELNPAVFFYTLEGTMRTGQEVSFNGNITLVD